MIDPNKIRERAIGSMYERKFCELADEIERLQEELKKHDAWLSQAHCLCSDMGIPHGHIEDRLFELIGKCTT